jgi:hypothetical protein
MSNIINEEINKMLYLFGYKRGVVISEQIESDELDEARTKSVNVGQESSRIFDEIRQRVIDNNEIMWGDYQILYKKNPTLLKNLEKYYLPRTRMYVGLSEDEKNNKFNQIMSDANENGDIPFQDVMFVSKYFTNSVNELKSLLNPDNPFSKFSKEDRAKQILDIAIKTGNISKNDYQYLRNNKPMVLQQIKPYIAKQMGRKKYMTDDILLDKFIEIENRVKSENNIRRRDYVYLRKNAPDILEELKPYWSRKTRLKNFSDEELNNRYIDIIESCKKIKDIYISDYVFLQARNPELLEQLRVYWGKYTAKPKPVVPEPVVVPVPEPPLVNEPVNRGVRGKKPLTDEQIKNRIEDIKNKFSETGKLETKDYQFLYKNDPELLKTIVRPKKRKPKMDFKLNPEEIDYEPMGKLGDYWTTSTTGDYDVNYNSK